MSCSTIAYTNWQPLSLAEVMQVFAGAPFAWGIAGGYTVAQFLGASIREHSDIDVVVYRDAQLQVQRWLPAWELYAADPPGTLRPWSDNEYLAAGIRDIWRRLLFSVPILVPRCSHWPTALPSGRSRPRRRRCGASCTSTDPRSARTDACSMVKATIAPSSS